jgi:hypothetical protein
MSQTPLQFFVAECCYTLPSTQECGIWSYQQDLEDVYRELLGQDPDRDWLCQLAIQYRVQTADPPGHHARDGWCLIGIALLPQWNDWLARRRTEKLGPTYAKLLRRH